MTQSRTVLQVLPRLVLGGVERGTVEVAAALIAAGHKAVVASEGGPMVRELEKIGATHITLPLASKNPLVMWRNIAKLETVIRHYKIDIVHARSRAPAWSAWRAAEQTHTPFVTTFHNTYGGTSGLKWLYNSVMAKGARVIAISNYVGEHAARVYGVGEDRLRVIHRGVDISYFDPSKIDANRQDALKHFWPWHEGRRTIVLPGRLTRWKGHAVLIEALALARQPNIQCFFVGSGDDAYRYELERLISQHHQHGVIHIVDNCNDMPAAYSLADVVISASTRPEGFGRVIIEAQAMGCPVIVTNHGGARETVEQGVNGWLVPPHDAQALATAITKALSVSQKERTHMTEHAIAHILTHFTTSIMTDRTLAVYDEVSRETHD